MQSSPNIQGFHLPDIIDPPRICVTLLIPDDPWHKAAFLGALFDLTQWINWQRDAAHTGTQAARVWRHIWQGINFEACSTEKGSQEIGFDMSDLVRVMCDDTGACILQYRCNVCDPWITVATLAQATGSGQPGGGQPQPQPAGPPVCYDLSFAANSLANLPTVVSAGDTIQIQSASGAGNPSGFVNWYCVDGETFFAGACSGSPSPGTPSPDTSKNYGALLALINGVYYYARPGDTITVPGGVTNAPVTFQANFPLSGASGSYHMQVCVTNNQSTTWSHTFDFRLGSFGWIPNNSVGAPGLWQSGVGWVPDPSSGLPAAYIDRMFSSRQITGGNATYFTNGGNPSSGLNVCDDPIMTCFISKSPMVASGSNQVQNSSGGVTTGHLLMAIDDNSATIVRLVALTLFGIGSDPF